MRPLCPLLLILGVGCAAATPYQMPDVEIPDADQRADPLKVAPDLIEHRETPGNLDRAIELLCWHWKRQPGSVDLNALLAEAHSRACEALDLKKPEDQVKHKEHRTAGLHHAREAVQIDPGHAPAHYWLAALLLHAAEAESSLGKANEAIRELDKAESLHPGIDDGGPARLKGRVLADMPAIFGGSVGRAIVCYKRSLEVAPTLMLTHLWLGEAYLAANKVDLAKKELDEVVAAQPRHGHEKEEGDYRKKAEELLKKLHVP